MLINRWLSVMLLFVICGCGPSIWEIRYNKLVVVHNHTLEELATEKTAHAGTRQKLATEETAHAGTRRELAAEETAHAGTRRELTTEETAHAGTRRELATEETAHAGTRRELATEKTGHRQLKEKHEALIKSREPSIRTYFELGRVSLEFGVIKEDSGKTKEAVSLYHQAKDALKEVIKGNESSDAHYYLARAYYRLAKRREADFKDACDHAKRAIELAPTGKHKGAEALKGKIANCK